MQETRDGNVSAWPLSVPVGNGWMDEKEKERLSPKEKEKERKGREGP